MGDLNGRVAVITGGANGIGLAMARRFSAGGAKLVVADVDESALEVAASELVAAGAEVLPVLTDVSQAEAVEALAAQTLAHYGRVDLVCNNAGLGCPGVSWELSHEEWCSVLGPTLGGVIHGVRAFMPHLVAQNSGHMINTASLAGLVSAAGLGPYNVAKHAVVTLSETLYGELRAARSDVGVSVLCPGYVRTRLIDMDRYLRELGRAPTPAETEAANALRSVASTAQPPEAIADLVVDAIAQKRFYILSDQKHLKAIESRLRAILEGRNPAVFDPDVFA